MGRVTFNQDVYQINQDITANNTDLVIGVENGIQGISQVVAQGTTSLDLGNSLSPGMFLLTFYFADNTTESYLLTVTNADINITNSVVDSSNYVTTADQKNIFMQVITFFKNATPDQRILPFTKGLQNYCVNNAVNAVKNVTFCISAALADGSLEILDSLCVDMTVDNLKTLTLEVYKELFLEMKNGGYLTQQQYDDLQVDEYVNLAKMLQNDCSAFFDFLAYKIDNPGLKLAIQYQGQLCSSTIAIISLFDKQ